jgi:hypothetical protein
MSWGEGGKQGKCGLRQPQPHNNSRAQRALERPLWHRAFESSLDRVVGVSGRKFGMASAGLYRTTVCSESLHHEAGEGLRLQPPLQGRFIGSIGSVSFSVRLY